MTYEEALLETIQNKDFVTQYDRLTKSDLSECLKSIKLGGLNLEIDKATGRLKDEILKFKTFFDDVVWSRLPEESFEK